MSIIQNIRERGTWIIFGIIAIALIAFILQDGIGRNKGGGEFAILGEINGQEINKIDFLKVDVEGAEYAVFEGISDENLSKVKTIAMEYHNSHFNFDDSMRDNFIKKLNNSVFNIISKINYSNSKKKDDFADTFIYVILVFIKGM